MSVIHHCDQFYCAEAGVRLFCFNYSRANENGLSGIPAMTSAGPTNLRIEYKEGKFKLDSVVLIRPKLKQFDSVVHLVEHYVQLSRTTSKRPSSGASQSLAPHNGTVQLLLTKPVYTATPSLQHLSRIAINNATRQVQELPLPNRLKIYLTDYSYNV